MSSCRCWEKQECNRKINLLSNICYDFLAVNNSLVSMRNELKLLSGAYECVFESTGISELKRKTNSIDDGLQSTKNYILNAINNTLANLRNEYNCLNEEDRAYHEEQERLRREREEQERLARLVEESKRMRNVRIRY